MFENISKVASMVDVSVIHPRDYDNLSCICTGMIY